MLLDLLWKSLEVFKKPEDFPQGMTRAILLTDQGTTEPINLGHLGSSGPHSAILTTSTTWPSLFKTNVHLGLSVEFCSVFPSFKLYGLVNF